MRSKPNFVEFVLSKFFVNVVVVVVLIVVAVHKGYCQVYCRAMAGSIEGPRRVLDLMGVNLCVPRVP